METKYRKHPLLEVTFLTFALSGLFPANSVSAETGSPDPNQSSKYLDAVREFADNVLKYGRDTYGPKHTLLFVDGLNIHTHEPVTWISPEGERWILCNLAFQQNLFRTLDGLTIITGDPKYKQAAMDAIDYAFKNLRSPNGLLHWGSTAAYDALRDKPCGRNTHVFKGFCPYYGLMWEVNPEATKQFIEALWSAHVIDWSKLEVYRIASLKAELEEPWEHEYKGGPVFFQSTKGSTFLTGSDLSYAAAILYKLSGYKKPLTWGKRLARRYIETRDPNTGISSHNFHLRPRRRNPLAEDFKGRSPDQFTLFPFSITSYLDPVVRKYSIALLTVSPGIPYANASAAGIWNLRIGELLGVDSREFTQWALEELTARGKFAYRKKDNVWIPMFLDGTSLEGYAYKEDTGTNPKGTVFKPIPAVPMDFWGYALAYRLTHDEFMWEMARDIGKGNGLGDIGATPKNKPKLQIPREHFDPFTLLAFLELYSKTGEAAFLQAAQKVGDSILAVRFHKGFFVPSSKHIYTKFDAVEALALLHLDAAIRRKALLVPEVWPGRHRFTLPFRDKEGVSDGYIIYSLTETPEIPRSLQEAAFCGDIEEAKSLIAQGADVNSREGNFLRKPLWCAVIKGHEDVVKLLLDNGAQVDAVDNGGRTALHHAAREGYKKMVELLLASGAEVNATDLAGDKPIDIAVRRNHREIVRLLVANGAQISMHDAVEFGDLERVKSLIANGADVNAKDSSGKTPLHYAPPNKDMVELLITNGADVNVKDKSGYTLLYGPLWDEDKDTLRLLLDKGANVNVIPDNDLTPLGYAIWYENKEMVELFVSHGAKLEIKDHWGYTALRHAAGTGDRELIEYLVSKGADISGFHRAACLGDLTGAKGFIQQGVDIDARDEMDWTPLHWAASTGREDLAEFLVSNGADVNAKTSDNSTPLHQAARSGSVKLVELLISKGADAKAADNYGTTPLHNAALGGSRAMGELLIEAGATIDVEDMREGDQTPLHKAARAGHKDVVELLLAKGADVNVKDNRGRTPLWHAENKGHTKIVELLRKHGAKE